MNGHVGSESDGYGNVHGGYGFGARNDEGVRILDFAVAAEMVVCNTLFKKENNKLITYSPGGVQSTIDYILTRRGCRNMVNDVKVIPGEPCVSQHRLLVGCFVFKKASNVKAKCKKRLRVWKLKNKESQLKFQERLREANTEMLWAQDVESKWELMKKAMLKATESVCGWTNGARRHKERDMVVE